MTEAKFDPNSAEPFKIDYDLLGALRAADDFYNFMVEICGPESDTNFFTLPDTVSMKFTFTNPVLHVDEGGESVERTMVSAVEACDVSVELPSYNGESNIMLTIYTKYRGRSAGSSVPAIKVSDIANIEVSIIEPEDASKSEGLRFSGVAFVDNLIGARDQISRLLEISQDVDDDGQIMLPPDLRFVVAMQSVEEAICIGGDGGETGHERVMHFVANGVKIYWPTSDEDIDTLTVLNFTRLNYDGTRTEMLVNPEWVTDFDLVPTNEVHAWLAETEVEPDQELIDAYPAPAVDQL